MASITKSPSLVLNPGILRSPPVDGRYTIYFSDRSTTTSLLCQEWNAIETQTARGGADVDAIFDACRDYIDLDHHCDAYSYAEQLLNSGILLQKDELISSEQRSSDLPKSQQPRKSRRSYLLVDVAHLFRAMGIHLPRGLVSIQLTLWPITMLTTVACLAFFYGGTNSIGRQLGYGQDTMKGIAKILVLFLGVNLLSKLSIIIDNIAVGVERAPLYFRWRWGFIPGFATDRHLGKIRRHCNLSEAALITAQPVMTRMYIIIVAITTLAVFISTPVSTSTWPQSIILAMLQASVIGIVIDILPIGNNTCVRFLMVTGLAPRNFFRLCLNRTVSNFNHIFHGRFKQIRHPVTVLIVFLTAIAITFQFLLIYYIVIPTLALDAPKALGHWTPLIVRLGLTLILVRYLFIRLYPLVNRGVDARPNDSSTNLQGRKRDSNISYQQLHLGHRLLHSRKLLLVLILTILLLPFPATISATATVMEAKYLDLRAAESGRIHNLYVQGPSERLIRQDQPLLEMKSDALESAIADSEQQILNLQAEIRTARTLIRSLSSGSVKIATEARDDDVASALADVSRYQAEVISLKEQLRQASLSLKAIKSLQETGAVSDLQVRTWEGTNARLSGQLYAAKSNLLSAEAHLRISQRSKQVDQELILEEQLASATDQLQSAIAKREQAIIAKNELQQRVEKLRIVMPFDGIVSSSTHGLMNRFATAGETLISVKALPLTTIRAVVPEYDRSRLRIGMPCKVRLYADPQNELHGTVARIDPTTLQVDGFAYVQATLEVSRDLPTTFIGSTGYAKLKYGRTSLLYNIIKPLARFTIVDLWSFLP